jgi:4-hydroxy-tetrahydrodipicolinate synthase
MVTPLRDRDTLDTAGMERLVEHILAGGVHGLFILGTTGEGPSLSYKTRMQVIDLVCEQVAGRVPVLVGITDTAFRESIELAEYARDQGADAVVLAPPYYFPAGQPELLEYVEHIAAALPLPLFLYNMPSHTKVSFEVETVRRALEFPNVVGLKDSSGQMIYFHEVVQAIKERPEFSLLVGPEQLLAETILLGGHGGVHGGANLAPELYVSLYNAAVAGDLERVRALHARVMVVASQIYTVGRHGSSYLKGLKCALSVCGICDDGMAEPFQRYAERERSMIAERLEGLGIGPRHKSGVKG